VSDYVSVICSFQTYLRSFIAASFARGASLSASPFHEHLLLQSGSRRNGQQHRVQAVADVLTEAPLPDLEVREKVSMPHQSPLQKFLHIRVLLLEAKCARTSMSISYYRCKMLRHNCLLFVLVFKNYVTLVH
jgi:hypothetical protein